MKKIISAVLTIALAASMFCVSFVSKAEGEVQVKFHSNNSLAADDFKTLDVSSGGTIGSFYDIPDVGERFIFKGWYYGKDKNARAVDIANDTFSETTDVYAHWADAGIVQPDSSDTDKDSVGFYDDFDLVGVQLKAGEFTDTQKGGLRFIASLSNNLIEELDDLSPLTTGNGNKVEYGFVAAKKTAVESWIDYGTNNKGYDLTDYKLGYNGENVNGVNTTGENGLDESFQGVVKNIDCTASDYSSGIVSGNKTGKDYKKFDAYRLYTVAITYPKTKSTDSSVEYTDAQMEEFKRADVVVRAYLRYYDANGQLRTTYDDYNGTNLYGGLSTSYKLTETNNIQTGYYSSVVSAKNDANNLTVANGTADPSSAVCSMYISGDKAYITLLKDANISSSILFSENVDFNLGGYTLDTGNYAIRSDSDFKMCNGTYNSGASATAFTNHYGALTKISNVAFIAENKNVSQFNGVLKLNDGIIYIDNCSFIISTSKTDSRVYGNVFYNSKQACVSNCTYDIDSAAGESYSIYSANSSIEVDGASFDMNSTSESGNVTAYAIDVFNSDNAVINNTEYNITGNYHNVCTVLAKDSANNAPISRFTEIDNYTLTMNINKMFCTEKQNDDDVLSMVRGLNISQGVEAVINNVKADITVKAAADAYIYSLYCNGNADVTASGIDIDVTTADKLEDSYNLYGIRMYATANLLLKSAEINIIPVLDKRSGDPNKYVERSVGVSALGESTVTIDPENQDDINIQGGNAALGNDKNAKFYVTGGNFRSPSHGGAYMGGDAEITGGKYYTYYVPGHTMEGAFYVTHDAKVNISNAQLISDEGMRALRTRNNNDYVGSPVVNVTNSVLKNPGLGVEVSSGVVYLNSGVEIQAAKDYTGNVVDNR